MTAAETYSEDFAASNTELRAEISLWRAHWTVSNPEENERPKNCMDTLFHCNEDFFTNIRVLLQIFATFPVTTATTERSFSTLKLVLPQEYHGREPPQLNCIDNHT